MGESRGSLCFRGPCGDGRHRRSCACRRGGRQLRRGRRTSRCSGEGARSGECVSSDVELVGNVNAYGVASLDSVDPTCRYSRQYIVADDYPPVTGFR